MRALLHDYEALVGYGGRGDAAESDLEAIEREMAAVVPGLVAEIERLGAAGAPPEDRERDAARLAAVARYDEALVALERASVAVAEVVRQPSVGALRPAIRERDAAYAAWAEAERGLQELLRSQRAAAASEVGDATGG